MLTAINVTPGQASTFIGEVTDLAAIGTFTTAPGSTTASTESELADATWSSSNTAVATVDGDGRVTGVSAGPATITASRDGFSDTALITVEPATLLSLDVQPNPASVAVGETVTLTVTGRFQNSPTAPVVERPASVTWDSSDESVATVNANGVVTGVHTGTATITATSGTVTDTVVVTVTFTPVLTGITVTPATATAPLGVPTQFTATGTFSAEPGSPSTTGPVPNLVWSIKAPATNASIDSATGIATGTAIGVATVVATSGTVSGEAQLTTTAPVLRGVVISEAPVAAPPVEASNKTIPLGSTQEYRVLGRYTDSDVPRLLPDDATAAWTSSAAAVTLNPTNQQSTTATAAALGTSTITATAGGFSDTLNLTVGAAALTTLARVEPPLARVVPGASAEFTAIGRFTDGSEQALPDTSVVWSTSDAAFATITSTGTATGVTKGQAIITATLTAGSGGTGSADARLLITDEVCTTPLFASEGATVAAASDGICLLCNAANIENVIDGNADNFATVNVPVGLLNAGESITIVGNNNSPNYDLPFMPQEGEVAGFILGRPAGALVLAELFSQLEVSTLLNGAVRESSGPTIPLRLDLLGLQLIPQSDTVLVGISPTLTYDSIRFKLKSGTATALSSVQLFAGCATARPPAPTAALTGIARVLPQESTVFIDSTVEYQAIGAYADGSELPLSDNDVTWTSTAPSVATVDAAGQATGVGAGTTNIRATYKLPLPSDTNRSAEAELTVAPSACTEPLLAPAASVTTANAGVCVLCNVSNAANAIDDAAASYATMSLNLAALGGSTSMTVSAGRTITAGSETGFVIGSPTSNSVLAQIGAGIRLTTFLAGVQQNTSDEVTIPLRVDLLGLELVSNGNTALASFSPAKDFDSIRLEFRGGLVSAISNLRVYSACGKATPPTVPPVVTP